MNEVIEKAKLFAIFKHAGQIDDNQEPHFLHARKVAELVAMVTDNPEIIAAAYLHDTIEDTPTTVIELTEQFGSTIARMVWEMTKTGPGGEFKNLKSTDAMLIKYADRLHNLSRMGCWPDEKQDWYKKKSKFWKGEL